MSRRLRLGMLPLPDRINPATIQWDGEINNNFNDARNWVGNILPGPGDDAVIGSAFSASTITVNNAITVNSITSDASLNIDDIVTTNVLQTGSNTTNLFLVRNSTLRNATIPVGSTLAAYGTLDNITLNGKLNQNGYRADIVNQITINGEVLLNGSGGGLRFYNTQTVNGTGFITYVSSNTNSSITVGTAGSTITFGSGLTIRGHSGYIGSAGLSGTFSDATFIYNNVIEGSTSGGNITLESGNHIFQNGGLIRETNGGNVVLAGTFTGIIPIEVGSIPTVSGALFDNVTITGELSIQDGNNGYVQNGLTINGTLYIGRSSASIYGGELRLIGTQTVGGTGTISFFGNADDIAITATTASSTITFGPTLTIRGFNGNIGYIGESGTTNDATYINQGVIHANTSGGTVFLAGGIHRAQGGTIRTTNGGSVGVSGRLAGQIQVETGSVLTMRGGTLDGVTLNGNLLVQDGSRGLITNGFTLNGTASIGRSSNSIYGGQLRFTNTQTVNGNGTFSFFGNVDDSGIAVTTPGSTIMFAPTVLIRGGRGFIGYNGDNGTTNDATFIYQGTVFGDTVNVGIYLSAGYHRFDGGTVRTANGGFVSLSGTLRGRVDIETGSQLSLSSGTLDGVTANGDIRVVDNSVGYVSNGLTLNGILLIGNTSASIYSGQLRFRGTQTVRGNATISFFGTSEGEIATATDAAVITFAPSVRIRGTDGVIGYTGTSNTFGNALFIIQGTVDVDSSGSAITLTNNNYQIAGTVRASNGGVVLAGTSSHFTTGVINGGTWVARNNGKIRIPISTVQAINGSVTIDGVGADFLPTSGSTTVFGPLASITEQGKFTVAGGRNLTTGPLLNQGSLTVGTSSTLTVNGNYTATATSRTGFVIGSRPTAPTFGKLVVNPTFTANLAGVFVGSVAPGFPPVFKPISGDRYEVINYLNRTGNFSRFEGVGLLSSVDADSADIIVKSPYVVPGPRVIAASPTTPSNAGVASVTVTFDKPIATFTTLDVAAILGPDGRTTAATAVINDTPGDAEIPNSVFRIEFPEQTIDGVYTVIIGPKITDSSGNQMNQNGNGVNGETTADRYQLRFAINNTDLGTFYSGVARDLTGAAPASSGFISTIPTMETARYAQLPKTALTLITSDEARTRLINRLYNGTVGPNEIGNFLNRPATSTEVANALAGLKNGKLTPELIIRDILATSSYFNDAGLGTNTAYVDAVYQFIYGRAPTSTERTTALATLSRNDVSTRQSAITTFLKSTAYRTELLNDLYTSLLGRLPNSTELATGLVNLNRVTGYQSTVQAILQSQEYYTRAGDTADSWITSIYSDLFGRAPTGTERTNLQTRLAANTSRNTLLTPLITSLEYRQAMVQTSVDSHSTAFFPAIMGRTPTATELLNTAEDIRKLGRETAFAKLIASALAVDANDLDALTHDDATQNWFTNVFTALMGRAPDSIELSNGVTPIFTIQAQARATVVQPLVTSDIYRNKIVSSIYQTYLGRMPNGLEAQAALTTLRGRAVAKQPTPWERVISQTIGTKEYFLAQEESGRHTNAAWIDAAFNAVLGRSPSPTESDAYQTSIRSAYSKQTANIITTIQNSIEARMVRVQDAYTTFLGRAATEAEVTSWAAKLLANGGDETMITTLMNSSEYQARVVLILGISSATPSDFVKAAYLQLAGRLPSLTEQQAGDVAVNRSRSGFVSSLLNSVPVRTYFIESSYQQLLGRAPTTVELDVQLLAFSKGAKRRAVVQGILASNAYAAAAHAFG